MLLMRERKNVTIGMLKISKMQLMTITDMNGNCPKIFNERRSNNNYNKQQERKKNEIKI